MQNLRDPSIGRPLWAVRHDLPGLLHAPGDVDASGQAAGLDHAGGSGAPEWQPWPGRRIAVRAPRHGETPLSEAEIEFGIARDLL